MAGNSQTARPREMPDFACAMALSPFLGKSLAEENRAQMAWPLSLRNPAISTRMRSPEVGAACAWDDAVTTNRVARASIARRMAPRYDWHSVLRLLVSGSGSMTTSLPGCCLDVRLLVMVPIW